MSTGAVMDHLPDTPSVARAYCPGCEYRRAVDHLLCNGPRQLCDVAAESVAWRAA